MKRSAVWAILLAVSVAAGCGQRACAYKHRESFVALEGADRIEVSTNGIDRVALITDRKTIDAAVSFIRVYPDDWAELPFGPQAATSWWGSELFREKGSSVSLRLCGEFFSESPLAGPAKPPAR